ncbi:hypothetical protein FIBSPDRAFT_881521 [Athelia psychrophila]|uniref:Uncharacterized protein n=1 Tax=Athelia psychrophila TaxID=1759441 RepID=A0A166WSN6_9AGAM|nr:hypothetical protein FIBSPDRAFT_881521 [Fibularhizoctonia sp. CBS 109695]
MNTSYQGNNPFDQLSNHEGEESDTSSFTRTSHSSNSIPEPPLGMTDVSGAGGMLLDDHSGAEPQINSILATTDQHILNSYVTQQVAAAITSAQARGKAPAAAPSTTEVQLIAVLQQMLQNSQDSNKVATDHLEREITNKATKSECHKKIGLVPSKFEGYRNKAEKFLTSIEIYL